MPNVNRRGRGDLYVTLHVVTPDRPLARGAQALGAARRSCGASRRRSTSRRARRCGARSSERRVGAGRLSAMDSSCLFCRIAAREIPAEIVRESERVVAFRDMNPQAPTHILLIPKEHVTSVAELERPSRRSAHRHHAGGDAARPGRRHRRRRAGGSSRTWAPTPGRRCSTCTSTCSGVARWAGLRARFSYSDGRGRREGGHR